MPVERLEAWLEAPQLKITRSALSATGLTAPRKIRIETAEGLSFNAKFKPVPGDLDTFNNSPRREIAAYRLQHHFLEPDQFVVPPTVLRCLPIADNAAVIEDLEAFDESDCALGVVAFWVEDISSDDVVDETDWVADPAYRDALGRLNTFTILIGHQDDIGENFYRTLDDDRPRLLSIDNGLSMGAMGANPIQLFSSSWSSAKVPSVPSDVVARLESLDAKALDDLMAVAQVERVGRSWARVEPGPPMTPVTEGVRRTDDVIQLGLTADEVTDIHKRLAHLLGEVRKRDLETHSTRRPLATED